MNPLQSLLDESPPYVLIDGAMGTKLMQEGLANGEAPELWNVERPDKVRAIHQAYVDAGAQVIVTNTFGGSPFRLKMHNLADRTVELNKAGAELVRQVADAAPHKVLAAASMGPSGELMQPLGLLTFEAARDGFAQQAEGLVAGGVDLLWIETMSDVKEVRAAVEGIRKVTDLPIVATMTFDTRGFTMMGTSPVQALDAMMDMDLIAYGGNCGNGPEEIKGVIKAMHEHAPDALLVAKSNAGLPRVKGGDIIYDGTPEVMADYALRIYELGARVIGACCGSTPAHIAAMGQALENAYKQTATA